MIVNDCYWGTKPVLKAYHAGTAFYARQTGLNLVNADYTGYGVTVRCQDGVIVLDGQVTGVTALFVRLSHSVVTGTSNTVLADPDFTIVPAGRTTTLRVRQVSGSCGQMADGFNVVLRDSANAAAINCKFAEGMRQASAAHANALAVFCLYLKAGCAFNRLTVLPSIVVA